MIYSEAFCCIITPWRRFRLRLHVGTGTRASVIISISGNHPNLLAIRPVMFLKVGMPISFTHLVIDLKVQNLVV